MIGVLLTLVGVVAGNAVGSEMFTALEDSFYMLDHNDDGVVTAFEAANGLMALQQETQSLEDLPSSPLRCFTSPDRIDFIDCVAGKAKLLEASTVLNFADELGAFLGDCDDVPAPLLAEHGIDCMALADDAGWSVFGKNMCQRWVSEGYCRLSCRSCSPRVPKPLATSATTTSATGAPLLISSDWHMEPWYDTTKGGQVSRFPDALINDMFECRAHLEKKNITCSLTGVSDPPIELGRSHMEAFSRNLTETNTPILFFIGDTQAHDYTGSFDEVTAVNTLIARVIQTMLAYFTVENIFYTAGNNDGPHDKIFVNGNDAVSAAWAAALVELGVVTNHLGRSYDGVNQVDFFKTTGYYIKQVDPLNHNGLASVNLYAIILNTNLGSSNAKQMKAFTSDLDWIANNKGKVYVLGHHPGVVEHITPPKYQPMVQGVFAGHVHFAASTTADLFTQVPAISEAATTTGYFHTKISANDTKVILSVNKDLIVYSREKGKVPTISDWKPGSK